MSVEGKFQQNQIMEDLSHGRLETVIVAFPDLQGRLVGKRVDADFFLANVKDNGMEACDYLLAVDIDMNPLPGFQFANWDSGYGDMQVICDMDTIRILPWLEKTALVLSDLKKDGAPVSVSPRQILKNQINRAKSMGLEVKCGTELEFFLFNESYEKCREKNYYSLSTVSDSIEDYQILETSREEDIIGQIRRSLKMAGLPVEYSKGEAGKGQHEINVTYKDALTCADNHVILKHTIKELAFKSGYAATFMAKLSKEQVGSSCHIHSSIWSDDQPLFWDDASDFHGLSKKASSWVAGQLALAKECSLLYAPYVNSYKRYQPNSWAPTAIAWGIDNRTLGFRLVGSGKTLRIENRIPGADCNPYVALAATIAAGIYGIENSLSLDEPYLKNGYEAKQLSRVPSSLPEAIRWFEGSKVLQELLGGEVHDHLLTAAKNEWISFCSEVTNWELKRGFERY